jgi:hypothetical protein
MSAEPAGASSPLSQTISAGELSVQVHIVRGSRGWLLKIIDEYGNATSWEDEFSTDVLALAEAEDAIASEGIGFFIGSPSGGFM